MSGLMSLKFENRQSGNSYEDEFDKLTLKLEKVSKIKQSLSIGRLNATELSLASFQLDRLTDPSCKVMRLENHRDLQQKLILRCEGIVGSIWEGIKKIINWICDKISSLFGGGSDSSSSSPATLDTEAYKKIEKERKEFQDGLISAADNPDTFNYSIFADLFKSNKKEELFERLNLYIESLKNLEMIAGFFELKDCLEFIDAKEDAADKDVEDVVKFYKQKFKSKCSHNVLSLCKDDKENILSAFYINYETIKKVNFIDENFKGSMESNFDKQNSDLETKINLVVNLLLKEKFAKDANWVFSNLEKRLLNDLKPGSEKLKEKVNSGVEIPQLNNLKLMKHMLNMVQILIPICHSYRKMQEKIVAFIEEDTPEATINKMFQRETE